MVFALLTTWEAEAVEGDGGLMVCQQQAQILPPNPPSRGKALAEGLPSGGFALARKMLPDGPAGIYGRACWESSGRAAESGEWFFCGAEVRHGLPARPVQHVLSGPGIAPLLEVKIWQSSAGAFGLAALEPAASLTLASPRVEQTGAYENTQGLIIREVHSSAPGGAGLQQPLWHGVLVSP